MFWSDSVFVLWWLRNVSWRFKPFVANWVSIIEMRDFRFTLFCFLLFARCNLILWFWKIEQKKVCSIEFTRVARTFLYFVDSIGQFLVGNRKGHQGLCSGGKFRQRITLYILRQEMWREQKWLVLRSGGRAQKREAESERPENYFHSHHQCRRKSELEDDIARQKLKKVKKAH